MTVEEIYCAVDDFMKKFLPAWEKQLLETGCRQRKRHGKLSLSEIATIVILFHQSNYRCFKHFYLAQVCQQLTPEFPTLISYSRMVRLLPSVLVPLCGYLQSLYGKPSGISYIDSTKLAVCHNIRIPRHKVFAAVAKRGKTSTGWFYGFKLHLVVNEYGEILSIKVTAGNVDDRTSVPDLIQGLFGKVFGDKGYVSESLSQTLSEQGIEFITSVRSNMKPKSMTLLDKILLRQRFIIETIIDQLKNISQIEHTRHRSLWNFLSNLMAGLIAYCHQPKKPSLNLVERGIFRMPMAI